MAGKATGRARRTASWTTPYAFLSPVIILFTLIFVIPIGYTAYLSFRKVKVSGLGLGRGSRKEIFAGLENYQATFSDSELWHSVLRVLLYGAMLVPTMLGLALLFALLLDERRVRARAFSRLSIFLPYAVPAVIASLLWGFLYLPSVSPLQYILDKIGGPEINFLGSTSIFFAVANIAVWGGTGFNMIVIYTALRAVPLEMYEAARLDGCTPFQIATKIKIPMVMPALIMTFVFSLIATLQVFSEPTTLRPMTNAMSSTWTPLMKIYQEAFVTGDTYLAAATSIVLAIATLIISLGFLRLVQSKAFGQES